MLCATITASGGPFREWTRERIAGELRSQGRMTSADESRLQQEIRFCRTADGVTPATPEHVTLPSSTRPGQMRHPLAADVAAAVACY